MLKKTHVGNYSLNLIEAELDGFILKKYPTTQDIVDNINDVALLLRDAVERFAHRTQNFNSRFEEAFDAAVVMTADTLQKTKLTAICKILKAPAQVALRWLKSRILNNLKSVMTNPKLKRFIGISQEFFDAQESSIFLTQTLFQIEIEKMDKKTLEEGLFKMFKNGDDVDDIRALAVEYAINCDFLLEKTEVEIDADGRAQLVWEF